MLRGSRKGEAGAEVRGASADHTFSPLRGSRKGEAPRSPGGPHAAELACKPDPVRRLSAAG